MIYGNDESSSHWPQRTIRDQRQAGEISPVNQTGCEPDPIRCPCKLECGYCRLRELLQQSAISQGVGQRDPFGRVERPERTDTSETEGGSGPSDTTATIVQSSTQRSRNIRSKSPLIFCPIYADSQQVLVLFPVLRLLSSLSIRFFVRTSYICHR